MPLARRSGCPINLSLEVIGDSWSLIVLRDIIFGGRRHFREPLTRSEEGIASNILADRLKALTAAGLLTRAPDPSHRQKVIYGLTVASIALLPVMSALGALGRRFQPVSEELSIRAQLLEDGGPATWRDFTAELREAHLGIPTGRAEGPTVAERLAAACEAAVARRRAEAEGAAIA